MLNASASLSTRSTEYTPTTCAEARAGLVSGPSKLNTVRTFRSRRASVQTSSRNESPGHIKTQSPPMQADGEPLRCQRRLTPSASISPKLPHLELTLRFPCLATEQPAPAATNARRVEYSGCRWCRACAACIHKAVALRRGPGGSGLPNGLGKANDLFHVSPFHGQGNQQTGNLGIGMPSLAGFPTSPRGLRGA